MSRELNKKSKYMTNQIEKKSKTFSQKADELREKSSYNEAASNYLNAILISRADAKAYFGLGMCHKHMGNTTKAIKYFDKATELDENYYEAFFELGICHQMEGIPCGAIKNFIRAIQINPDSPEAILQLGISHELCDETEMAMMVYQKLIENSPEFAKGHEHKSSLLMKMENYRAASRALNKMIKIDPKNTTAYAGIGICLDKLGKHADAQRYYRKFLVEDPTAQEAGFVKDRLAELKLLKKTKIPFSIV